MTTNNEKALVTVQKHLARGGALCKEFNRLRLMDHMNWRVEQAYALELIRNSDKLQRCTPESIGRSLIDLGVMGLSLSPAKKEAYLIPYKGNCTASPSYMGLEQIAYRTGMFEGIQCGVVRSNDDFEQWADDQGKHIRHTISSEGGEVTHSYCIAWLTTGRTLIEVMDRAALSACREAAARKNNGEIPFTWKGKFREEMYKKAAMRRGWKHWPKVESQAINRVLDAIDRTDPMDFSEDKSKVVAGNERAPTLDQSHIDELCDLMRGAGYDERRWSDQLKGLAVGMGHKAGIRTVPLEKFPQALELMERGLESWQERMSLRSQQSTSKKADTTAQGGVT